MPNHSPEPWVKGAWEDEYRGRKLYHVFRANPQDIHSQTEVWSGVKDGDSYHCSEKRPGKVVIGMDFDYSNSGLLFKDDDIERAIACVNALAGIENPEKWVREAKKAMAFKPGEGLPVLCKNGGENERA